MKPRTILDEDSVWYNLNDLLKNSESSLTTTEARFLITKNCPPYSLRHFSVLDESGQRFMEPFINDIALNIWMDYHAST